MAAKRKAEKAEKKYDLHEPMPNDPHRVVLFPKGEPSVPRERIEAAVKAAIAERLAKGKARSKDDGKG